MNTLLVTVDSLRHDHFGEMNATREYLRHRHERAFATSTATLGSFPAIVSGEYAQGGYVDSEDSVAHSFDALRTAITTNHLLSREYGYADGFDSFTSPKGGGETLKDKGAVWLQRGTVPYEIATWGWNRYQTLRSVFSEIDKSFRPAESVIDQFLGEIDGEDEWFGWLHFMEPHHPYDPDGAPMGREESQRVTRRVLAGKGSEADEELVRELYRLEVVSLIDVPTVLTGAEHGLGTLDRDVAFAAYGDRKAAMNATHIATSDGTRRLSDGEQASNPSLERSLDRFDPEYVVKEEALREDLEDLGYA